MPEKITLRTHFDLLQYFLPPFPSPSPPSFYSQHHCLHVWLMLDTISQGYREAQLLRRLECPTWKWICSQMWTSNHLRILFLLHLVMWTVPFGSNRYTSTHLPSNCKVKNHSLTMQCLSSRWKGRGYMQILLQFLLQFPAHTVTLPL